MSSSQTLLPDMAEDISVPTLSSDPQKFRARFPGADINDRPFSSSTSCLIPSAPTCAVQKKLSN
ncbi:hypothetical protein BYT27DRAFT_7182168 [Phlegmacium glaucopus]|nr:hypothetical protein BYT27DRAFT_7182168 [Phlegmacium glaucopus]